MNPMKHAWIVALALFLFVTLFFQKSGMTGWIISALSFAGFLYFYIAYGEEGKSGKVESGEIESGEVESGEVESGEVESGKVESEEVESEEVESEEAEIGIEMEQHFAVDPKVFLTACYKNDIEKVRELLEDGFDIEVSNHQEVTAFMFAVKGKAYDVVRYLIENEVDVTRVSEKGTTAMKIAEENGDDKMIEILNG